MRKPTVPSEPKVPPEPKVRAVGDQARPPRRAANQRFDYAVTLCDRVRERCPDLPGAARRLHWSIPNPDRLMGSLAALPVALGLGVDRVGRGQLGGVAVGVAAVVGTLLVTAASGVSRHRSAAGMYLRTQWLVARPSRKHPWAPALPTASLATDRSRRASEPLAGRPSR